MKLDLRSLSLLAAAAMVTAMAGPAWSAKPAPKPAGDPVLNAETAKVMREAAKADTRAKPAPAPVLPALSAETIAERNAAARGGASRWAAIKTMSISGKLDAGRERRDGGTVGGMTSSPKQARLDARAAALAAAKSARQSDTKVIQLPYRVDFQRPTLMRAEVDFKGQTAVQVWDGASGWKLRPFIGRNELEPFTAEEMRIARSQQELDGPLINYRSKGVKVASDGTERVEGHDCYRLKLTLKDGESRRLWVDAKTFLEVKAEDQPRHFNGKDRMVYTVFDDWRPVQGLQVAHKLETRVEGVPQSNRIVFEQVALNSPIAGTRFAKPELAR